MDKEVEVLEFYSDQVIANRKHRLAMLFAKDALEYYRHSSDGKVRMLYANGFYYAVDYYPYDYLTGNHTFYATVLNKDGFVLLDKTEVLDSHDQIFDGKDLILRTKDSILHYQLQNDLNFFPPQDIQLVRTFRTNEMHTYSNIKNIVFMNEKAYNYKTQSMIDFQ